MGVAVAAPFLHLRRIEFGPHSAWGNSDHGAALLDGRDGNIPAPSMPRSVWAQVGLVTAPHRPCPRDIPPAPAPRHHPAVP